MIACGYAGMVELADTLGLSPNAPAYGFKSHYLHQIQLPDLVIC